MNRSIELKRLLGALFVLAAGCGSIAFAAAPDAPAVAIATYHGDAARTGWNAHEPLLSPETVKSDVFGKVWETVLDGQVYASPLYLSGIEIGGAKRDVVYAATERNSVYALDAETGRTLWGPINLAPPLDATQYNDCNNISPWHGITGTPVIDMETKTLYVCGVTQPGFRQQYRVWALDVQSGGIRPGWPVTLKGSYKGCTFDAGQLTQRGALNLVKGWLYLPFGSRCDIGEWHGWIMGVDVANPSAPQRAFSPAPTADGGGIWGAGGISADEDGRLYCVTGNGAFDLDKGGSNVCESILRLTPQGSEILFSGDKKDYYLPANWKQLDAADVDLGGSSPILLPAIPQFGQTRLLLTCGKDGLVYLTRRDALGGVGGELQKQRLFGDPKAAYHSNIKTTPAYFDGGEGGRFVYVTGNETGPNGEAGMVALRLQRSDDRPVLSVAWTLKRPLFQPGAPFVSSDGAKNGIVWVVESNKDDGDLGPPGVLYAFDAVSGETLFRSNQNAARDTLGDARKFSCPTAANGRVFVGTHGIVAYGVRSGSRNGAAK